MVPAAWVTGAMGHCAVWPRGIFQGAADSRVRRFPSAEKTDTMR